MTLRAPWEAMRLVAFTHGAMAASQPDGRFVPLPQTMRGNVTWSPHGDALYTHSDGHVDRCTAPAGPCTTIVRRRDVSGIAIAPDDGHVLVMASSHDAAVVVDTRTGAQQSTQLDEGVWLDATHIVHHVARRLLVWDIVRHDDRPLAPAPTWIPDIMALVPSPDGRWIAVIGNRRERRPGGAIYSHPGLGIVDVAHDRWGPYFEQRFGGTPAWSPDSSRLAYTDEKQQVTLLDVRADHPQPEVFAPALAASPGVAVAVAGWLDGLRIAYLRVDHVDGSALQFGHGVIVSFCDLVVGDLARRRETALTDHGALDCAAQFTRAPAAATAVAPGGLLPAGPPGRLPPTPARA
jgi:WD40 repeat protein